MSNQEFGSIHASQSEASSNIGGELRRPSRLEELRERALESLKYARSHADRIAATLALLSLNTQVAYAENHQIEEPVVGIYTAYLPIAGKGADFRRIEPGHTPTPVVDPIDPTEPRPSPTRPLPSPTMPLPSATPTEAPPTVTPERPITIPGLKDSTVGAMNGPLDPFARKDTLKQRGITSTDTDLINVDLEAEGTGVIRATDGSPVAYRLKLTEPGIVGSPFFEVHIDVLKSLLDDESFQKLIKREYIRAPGSADSMITMDIAHETRLFQATDADSDSNPLHAVEDPQGSEVETSYVTTPHIRGILGTGSLPDTVTQTHIIAAAPQQLGQSESIQNDEKTYGSLKPVSEAPYPVDGTLHNFIQGHIELPTDSGITFNVDARFQNFGVIHLSYLADKNSPNSTGFGVLINDNQLFVGNYQKGEVDGPYEIDTHIERGVLNVSIKFKDEKRDHIELAVKDKDGKVVYYSIPLKWPLIHQRTIGVEVGYSLSEQNDAYIKSINAQIPTNSDRLQRLDTDPLLAGLDDLNTNDGALGNRVGVTLLSGMEGTNFDSLQHGSLIDGADMLFIDRSYIFSRGKEVVHDTEVKRTSDRVVNLRPYANAERLNFLKRQREKNPNFFAAYQYDLRYASLHYEGYGVPELLRDFKLFHIGAQNADGVLVDAPLGLIGISGELGDFVSQLGPTNRPLNQRVELVGQEFVKAMPDGVIWDPIPVLDPKMPLGSNQRTNLLTVLGTLNENPRISIKAVIASAIPSSPMSGTQHETYLMTLRSSLNEAGYLLHIKNADGGVLSDEQVHRILSGQMIKDATEPVNGIAIKSDPRTPERYTNPAGLSLVNDRNLNIVRRRVPQKSENFMRNSHPTREIRSAISHYHNH